MKKISKLILITLLITLCTSSMCFAYNHVASNSEEKIVYWHNSTGVWPIKVDIKATYYSDWDYQANQTYKINELVSSQIIYDYTYSPISQTYNLISVDYPQDGDEIFANDFSNGSSMDFIVPLHAKHTVKSYDNTLYYYVPYNFHVHYVWASADTSPTLIYLDIDSIN